MPYTTVRKDKMQKAIVTGGNKGLGFEICRQLAQNNCDVLLTSRDKKRGRAATEKLQAAGLSVTFYPLDVRYEGSIYYLMEHIKQTWGRVDILVNNAGIFLDKGMRARDLVGLPFDRTFITNVRGPILLMQSVLPFMERQGFGRIVNVSSQMGSIAQMQAGSAAYRLSKASLNAFTKIIAQEVDSTKIKINAIDPGWVKTDMGGDTAPETPEDAASGVVWAALLPADGPSGGFFHNGKEMPF